ncbi:response regulator [Streptomyces sp. NPDC051098]|uniref:response regulator n=1 Tax=Streptomyces sp. NPDC051098 TaxID=3155411 RepID=UPI003420AC2F
MKLLDRPLRPGDPIAIIEDEEVNRRATGWIVEEADFTPVPVSVIPSSVDELIAEIETRAVAVICDHRLGRGGNVSYYGAEVVAMSNRRKIPAVLLTSYANSDENSSIRRWRSEIPMLLSRGSDSDPERLAQALSLAEDECRGVYTEERKPYRAIVRVQGRRFGPEGVVAECVVTAWQPRTTVDVPASMITENMGVPIERLLGKRLSAEVNIYASTAGELYFQNFKMGPGVPSGW